MNTKTYNIENITAYLLGTLPEAEAELFDELSFVDDRFADELNAAETDLVDAFVNGELQGKKLEQFENFYLSSPVRREKVEFARAFQVFAEENIAETGEKVPTAVEETPKQTLPGFWANFFSIPRLYLQWGLVAATLVLVFFGGWLLVENNRLIEQASETQSKRDELARRELELQRQLENERVLNSQTEKELAQIREEREQLEEKLKDEQLHKQQIIAEQRRKAEQPKEKQSSAPNQISIASFILAPPVRSSTPSIAVPAQTDLIKMQLELESDEFAAYRVKLVSQDNQTLWQSGRIKAGTKAGGRVLNIQFPAKNIKPQVYSLVVSGLGKDGTAEIFSSYSFRAVLN